MSDMKKNDCIHWNNAIWQPIKYAGANNDAMAPFCHVEGTIINPSYKFDMNVTYFGRVFFIYYFNLKNTQWNKWLVLKNRSRQKFLGQNY